MNFYKVYYRKPGQGEKMVIVQANTALEAYRRFDRDLDAIVTGVEVQ